MTSKLRIDLSHKTERLRFLGISPSNFLTAMHSYFTSLGGKRSGLKKTCYFIRN